MGVSKTLLTPGDGQTFPRPGDSVTLDYSGYLYDESAGDHKGRLFDSTRSRGPFTTVIGKGKVIRGWDAAVPNMTKGEKSVLTISSDFAYGKGGFPSLIPADADLVFEVELKDVMPS